MTAYNDHILVLGLGNTLLSDEAAGVRVVEAVAAHPDCAALGIKPVDGGTMGLTLLVEMEEAAAMVIADSAMLNAMPGTVEVFEGGEMDHFLRTRTRNAHDIGLDDVLDGLRLRGKMPERRALVGIQPAKLTVGEALTPAVADGVAEAAERAIEIVRRWRDTA